MQSQTYCVPTRADRELRDRAEIAFCAAEGAAERAGVAEGYIARAARSEAEIAFLMISTRTYGSEADAQRDLSALVCKVVERLSPLVHDADVNVEFIAVINFLARIKELPPVTTSGGSA